SRTDHCPSCRRLREVGQTTARAAEDIREAGQTTARAAEDSGKPGRPLPGLPKTLGKSGRPLPGLPQFLRKPDTLDPGATDLENQMKAETGKDIWLIGGGEIITLMHEAGLIDEYIIAYVPVILGEGIELFPKVKTQLNLALTRHEAFKSGIVMLYLEKERLNKS